MNKEKGIIFIAAGHPNYGRLAYNLAITIKAASSIPITVVRTDRSLSHLSERQLQLFDQIIDLPADVPIGCGAKLWANKLSPYKKTLLLDADMLWLPKLTPEDMFNSLENIPFTAISEGYWSYDGAGNDINPKYFFWAAPEEIAKVYPIKSNKLYQWRSEVMYFEKGELVNKLFATARKVFLSPGLTSIQKYATGVADELGINVACAVHDIHPHEYKWSPSYWHMINGGHIPDFSKLYANHYLVSFGSNVATGNSKDLYNRLVKAACYKLGLQHVFSLQSKRDYLPERNKI